MTGTKCPIWDTPAELLETPGLSKLYDSPRAGGKFWITGSAEAVLESANEKTKSLLTSWLCDQRHAGVETPKVDSDTIQLAQSRRQKPISQRLSSALLFIGNNIECLGESVKLLYDDDFYTQNCFAETESTEASEITELYSMLREIGRVEGIFNQSGQMNIRPTATGWQEIERLTTTQNDSSQAFVAMWFNDATDDAYKKGIYPALSDCGYKPMRIDEEEHNDKIDDRIIAEIKRSRFLVADFTCEPEKVRGGVYYEAGFAQGLGLPVIWTCKHASKNDLHFDTRQYSHIMWNSPEDLYTKLKNRIGATIGVGPLVRK